MNQRDLLELEQAARTIVAVVERNRISDETAAERRENFILLPGGGNYQPQKERTSPLSRTRPNLLQQKTRERILYPVLFLLTTRN